MKNITINKKTVLQVATLIVFAGIVLFIALNTEEAKKLLNYVLVVLKPFIYGFCIAFVLNLLSKQIDNTFAKHAEKKGREYNIKKHRKLSITISLLVFIAFAALAIGMIIPNLKDTIVSLYKQAPTLWANFLEYLDKLKTERPKLAGYITTIEDNLEAYYDKTLAYLKNNLSSIASTAITKIKGASNVLINFGLGFIIAFAMLVYKEELVSEVFAILKKSLPEKHYKRACYVINLANKKFQIYLKFNLVQAVITGAGTFIFMLICGMPYKASISLLITVTQLVPIVGAIIGTAVGALLIAAVSPVKALIFVVLSILVQQAVEKLINPHLMGKELEMPGILTFLAVVIGGKQFGLVGLICAVPFVSVCYDIYTVKLRPRIHSKAKEIKEDIKDDIKEIKEEQTED
jgi:predicted PurR-regulated permease PerM